MTQETNKPQRMIEPYLIMGLVAFYMGHWIGKSIEEAPATVSTYDFFRLQKLRWFLENPLDHSLIDPIPSFFSLFLGLICFGAILMFYFRSDEKNTYRYQEEHGSARFATAEELKKFRDELPENDIIFTQQARMGIFNKRLAYAVQVNKNILVVGLPGDWKTRAFVKPGLLQTNSSFVVTDPKGLLVHEVGYSLKEAGYKIKVFDLVTLQNTCQFNVFHYMTTEVDIDRVAESIIQGTKKSDHQGEDFWVQAEMLLIRALIGYLYFSSKYHDVTPHLAQVADMLRLLKRDNPDVKSPVELMFEQLDRLYPDNYASKQFYLFMRNFGGQTLMSVLAITSSRFAVFDHDDVRNIVKDDTLDIGKWQLEKTAVFIAIPETDKTYNFLANLLFVTMFRILPNIADEILQGRHPTHKPSDLLHLRAIMDEFAQLNRIPYFTESQSSLRSREISLDVIVQALSQLQTTYKDEWKTILNNCGTLLYLGTNDKDTMEYFSLRAGKQTIHQRNLSKTYSQQGSSSESIQTVGRPLLTPDEVARIGIDEALVFISKQNVFRDKKYNLESHPRAHLLADHPDDPNWFTYNMANHDIPEWDANVKKESVA
ncbi:VirD4-like conjugal transfer protein, CD1115 family [Streptococcus suis]|uniref:VirD4-like conjugal transfer protein, CD1115 family n=1 Tax=Streptococcus suis TaxID=1307 RepID=UPI000CF583A8|nr:type IV secretory system conjugative DNA transfer family protein [Streptococcus suis]